MKHKGLKTSLMLSILCLLVAVIALGAVTYAWFTFDPYTNVTPMEGKISGGEANLLISDKPTTGFAKSCVLVPEHMAGALSPISTENLTDFFVSTYQEEGISKRFSQVSKAPGWKPEKYLIHGTVYLKSAGGGQMCISTSRLWMWAPIPSGWPRTAGPENHRRNHRFRHLYFQSGRPGQYLRRRIPGDHRPACRSGQPGIGHPECQRRRRACLCR